jgi:hypothetical protein
MSEAIHSSSDEKWIASSLRSPAMTIHVMAGLVPAIHVFCCQGIKDVDARHKAGHDDAVMAGWAKQSVATSLQLRFRKLWWARRRCAFAHPAR